MQQRRGAPKSPSNQTLDSDSTKKNSSGKKGGLIPLSQRLYDVFFIIFFVNFFFIAWGIDYINAFGGVGGLKEVGTNEAGQKLFVRFDGITKENTANWQWPPKFLIDAFFWWCEMADPLLAINPLWLKVLALLSPLVYSPFYLFAVYAFTKGSNLVRVPGLLFAWGMLITLVVLFIEGLIGEVPTPNITVFTAAYGPYLVFPLVLMYRLRSPHVFTRS